MSLFEEYQLFRRILCLCPFCNKLARISDLRLKAKGPAPKTWLDEYEIKDQALTKKEGAFEEEAEKLREEAGEKERKRLKSILQSNMPLAQKPKIRPI